MSKYAVINWNAEKLKSVKRDILFFENVYYDSFFFKLRIDLMINVAKLMKHEPVIIDEIQANIDFLEQQEILKKFDMREIKEGKVKLTQFSEEEHRRTLQAVTDYDKVHTNFLNKYNEVVNLLQKNYNSGFLKFINLLEDFEQVAKYHSRVSSLLLSKINVNNTFTSVLESVDDFQEGKESTTIQIIVSKFPIPNNNFSLQDILDFKNDSDNKRRYLGLVNWINEISKSNLSVEEIKDKLEYLTLEFENKMKLEKIDYNIGTVETIITLPLEIVENILKLNWSKIPKSILQIKRNKVKLLLGESGAFGREIAYISKVNEKFK
ncbi:hypothetical protein ACE193_12995 [Bernardetia sp. OM2101]|uniref:hypothetical protein n=1 Tax=Bernardetia sp. OM2101 TaxID=3344876 RepID=UPI0035CEA63D